MPATAAILSRTFSRELLAQLSELKTKRAQTAFLSKHPELVSAEMISWLADSVRERSSVDGPPTVILAQLSILIAQKLRKQLLLAQSLRTMGNALYLSGQNAAALRFHNKASKTFSDLGNKHELARTLNASIQPLILTGKYEGALSAAERAHQIFLKEGNDWRAARVDINAGNIFQRQGQYAQALERYERARHYFLAHPEKDAEALAAALHNSATCLMLLNDFSGAHDSYEQARRFADQHGMTALVAQVDYNIASLYYLEGQYTRAIELLRSTRENRKKIRDDYHVALSHLDLSEIYLELNQGKQAEEMARQAAADFDKLNLVYESGKALANLALARWQQNDTLAALELFARARKKFSRDKNEFWCSRVDLYRAIILAHRKQHSRAMRFCFGALKVFRKSKTPYTLIQSHLLLAHIFREKGRLGLAYKHCSEGMKRLCGIELPALRYQAYRLMAQIRLAMHDPESAYRHYEHARQGLEQLRSRVSREELRISFMKNRNTLYEEMIELCLQGAVQPRLREAFENIEESKSRSLCDLMFNSNSDLQLDQVSDEGRVRVVRELRAKLNCLSRRYETEQLEGKSQSIENTTKSLAEIHRTEDELLRAVRELPLPIAESAGLASPKPVSLEEFRAILPAKTTFLEYFQIRDRFMAVVLSHEGFDILDIAPVDEMNDLMERLRFQFAKFRLSPQYVDLFAKSLHETTLSHLRQLHTALIQPVRKELRGEHLVIVPHGSLHALPFQALFDGEQYLLDSFRISYAPSATAFTLCHSRTWKASGKALVFGIADANAPLVAEEARVVSAAIGGSELFLGEAASSEVLREKGPSSSLIHIATHGYFRQDNPMFSGIQLGDGILTLYDLYQMTLPAELITLSGCATGLNVVAEGDELLGLLRGLFYAGAQAALLTLWDVHDRSTAEFMASFYSHLNRSEDKAAALRDASLEIREKYPHPYYWAPFCLVGIA